MQGHFEACALRRFWASLLPAAVVICLKSLLWMSRMLLPPSSVSYAAIAPPRVTVEDNTPSC